MMAPHVAPHVAEEESESLVGSTPEKARSKSRKSMSPSHPYPPKSQSTTNSSSEKDNNSLLRFVKFAIVCFPYIALLVCLNSRDIRASELLDESTYQPKHANVTGGYVRPNVIYGHVHIAKAGGTTLNGILANKFERVCGHKGYSYDAYQRGEDGRVTWGAIVPWGRRG